MTADAAGNDLDAVAVPITGHIAVAPVDILNVISPSQGGQATLTLPVAYRKLGLIKTDGGFEPADAASGDPLDFWQDGYRLTSSEAESTLKVSLAQNDPIVREIVRGVAPDANGHIYVEASGSNEQYLATTEEVYKTKAGRLFLERTNGVVRVQSVERDKSERGTVRGWIVTFERVRSALFGGTHYSEWVVNESPAAPTAWAATTAYAVNDQVSLSGGAVLKATVAGTSDATAPTAPASVGGTVVDGTVTWERVS